MIAVRAQQVKPTPQIGVASTTPYTQGMPRPQAAPAPQPKPAPKIGVAFAAVPLDVLKDRDLSPAARLAFAALANHARMKRGEASDYTNRKLAENAGLSVGTARRCLEELEAAGLIRRLYGPTQRIRLAVAITYQGRDPEQASGCAGPASSPSEVAQAAQQGCAPAGPEVAQTGAGDLLRGGEELPKSPALAPQGAEERNPDQLPDGHAAAAYLRRCVAAARRGEPMPEPPESSGLTATKGVHQTDDLSMGIAVDNTPSATPTPSQDATGITVGRMVADLVSGFTRGVLDVRRPSRSRQRPKR